MITGNTPHRTQKKDNLQDTLMNTATAVLKAVSQHSPNSSIVQSSPQIGHTIENQRELGVSPGKASEIRSKSYSQLSTLKQLYDDGVLSMDEFEEQKKIILSGLKKL